MGVTTKIIIETAERGVKARICSATASPEGESANIDGEHISSQMISPYSTREIYIHDGISLTLTELALEAAPQPVPAPVAEGETAGAISDGDAA